MGDPEETPDTFRKDARSSATFTDGRVSGRSSVEWSGLELGEAPHRRMVGHPSSAVSHNSIRPNKTMMLGGEMEQGAGGRACMHPTGDRGWQTLGSTPYFIRSMARTCEWTGLQMTTQRSICVQIPKQASREILVRRAPMVRAAADALRRIRVGVRTPTDNMRFSAERLTRYNTAISCLDLGPQVRALAAQRSWTPPEGGMMRSLMAVRHDADNPCLKSASMASRNGLKSSHRVLMAV